MESHYVIRCNGSWNYKYQKEGFAAVASHGNIILTCVVGVKLSCTSLPESELRGLHAGLKLAAELALSEVVIVSDSVETIWAIHSGCLPSTKLTNLTSECVDLLLANPQMVYTTCDA